MFRSLVVVATVVCAIECTVECNNANAQGRMGKACRTGARGLSRRAIGNHGHYGGPSYHRSHYASPSFGFSIGIGSYPGYGYSSFGYMDPYRFDGFGYDPYRYGSFRAPDLLNDPYFRERYRYDSRFPGRHPNRYRAPLVVAPAFPIPIFESYGSPTAQADANAGQVVPVNPADLAGQLRSAAQQLTRTLSTGQNGAAWMAYLEPHQISQLIASGNSAALRELLTRYDGVYGNPQRRVIVAANGFGVTRRLLRQYVNQPMDLNKPIVEEPTVESLPLPEAKSVPESMPIGDLDI
jgi:hypothetical protein